MADFIQRFQGFLCLLCIAIPLPAQDLRVTASKQIVSNGGRITWGQKNNLLAFDSLGANGYYDVYTSKPDGSDVQCLTCKATTLPAYNRGNPEWHPSNSFLAVQVQYTTGPLVRNFRPGVGVGNDLYITDAGGINYWPVTFQAAGVLHPRFSHDGAKLLWVQKTPDLFTNNWNLMLGDFSVDSSNVPHVTNVQSLPPCAGDVFCETGGFSADDSSVFFTGTLNGQSNAGIDIYSYKLSTQTTTRLTSTPGNWDEFPMAVPGSSKIIWMSGVLNSFAGLKTEYWMMDENGSNKLQLTYFNDPAAPAWYLGKATSCAKFNWSPDGTALAAYFIPSGNQLGESGSNYVIDLAPAVATLSSASYARPPIAADSILSSFAANLASSIESATGTSLPSTLGNASITVTDALGTSRAASLFFASPGQVNWLVPTGTASGPATVTFQNAAGTTQYATIDVESAAPGLYTATGTGTGPAAGYLLLYPAAGGTAPVTFQYLFSCASGGLCTTQPVNLGGPSDSAYLILFGTGLRNSKLVSATLGGQPVTVTASGAQGVYSGLDQVNILIPHSFAGRGLLDVAVNTDASTQNAGGQEPMQSNVVQVAFQ